MAEIIKFHSNQLEDDELVDEFVGSLNKCQEKQFFEIIHRAKQEYDALYKITQDITKKYIEKVNECETLKSKK